MKAGGPNYVKQFINVKTKKSSSLEIEKSFNTIYKEHFRKEKDYSKIRGQHNIFRYIKASKIIILINEKTKQEDLEIVLISCRVTKIPFELLSLNKNNKLTKKTISMEKLTSLLDHIDENTRFRSLIEELPSKFMKDCHQRNISVYNRTPCSNGRIELLNYFNEQSLSINFHRYGNLMGETNI